MSATGRPLRGDTTGDHGRADAAWIAVGPLLREMSIVACSVYVLLPVFSLFFFLLLCFAGHRASMQPGARTGTLLRSGSTAAPLDLGRISDARRASDLISLIYRLDPIRGSASASRTNANGVCLRFGDLLLTDFSRRPIVAPVSTILL